MRTKFKIFILIVIVFSLLFPAFAQNEGADSAVITMRITGKNIESNILADMIKDYLIRMNVLNNEAQFIMFGAPSVMKINSSADVFVVTGTGQKNIKVRIENYDIPDIDPVFLMFSNHPEKVYSCGVLFNAACVFKKKVRLQFYHLSAMNPVRNAPTVDSNPPKNLEQSSQSNNKQADFSNGVKDKNPYLSLRFYNPDKTKTAKIHILGDMQGPSDNFMKIGHQNNIGFLNKKNNKLGMIYEIKPGSTLDLFNEEMPFGKLFCGIYEMYLIDGPPVSFYMFANKTKDEKLIYSEINYSTDVHAKGVYMVSDFTWDVKFTSDEKEKYIVFGDTPLRNIFPQKKLAGDYGAIYNINLLAKEVTGKSGRLEIIFQPRGGAATGTFIIDGRLLEIGTTKAKIEKKIWSYNFSPYQSRLIKIRTMPEGASYYPVRIIFRFIPE